PSAVVRQAIEEIDRLPVTRDVRASLAAHAPYTVSPRVFRAIGDAMARRPHLPCSVHLSEAREEIELVENGGGEWRRFLEEVGSWDSSWTPPRGSPVRYLDEIGFLGPR